MGYITSPVTINTGIQRNEFDNAVYKQGKTCTQLGMVANNESSATANRTILLAALNAGIRILIDDKYYINCGSYVLNGTPVTEDIYIEGININAEICFTDTVDREFINVQGNNFILENVRITMLNNNDNYVWAFTMKDSLKMNLVKVKYNYFEGNIRLFTWYFTNSVYIDPTVTDFGITNFIFNYNICKSIKTRSHGFIYFHSTPITHSELIGNNIHNFCYVLYDHPIDNENTYKNKVAEAMNYLEVRNNVVINDLNWNGCPEIQTYHCFILFEGNKCEYTNNHVEGLHTFDKIHSLTLSSVVAGNAITLNGITFTAVASGAVIPQFNVGGDNTTTATNLANAISGSVLGITATASGSSVIFNAGTDDAIVPTSVSSTITVVSIGLYDAYLSCWEKLYEGNTWKNNINFTPMKQYNDLMKSKEANKDTYNGVCRIYRNNTFIVEESYVTAINTANGLSRTTAELWVDITYFQDEIDTVIIENNIIDVYELGNSYDQEIHNYYFNNNKIHAYVTRAMNNCLIPMHPLTTADTTAEYIARNNIVIIDTANTDVTYGYGKNFLIMPTVNTTLDVKTAKVIFENNHIEWPNLGGLIGTEASTKISILSQVRMTGNIIISDRPGSSAGKTLLTTQYCEIRKFVFDNEIVLSHTTSGFLFNPTPKGGHQYQDYKLKLKCYPIHATNHFLGLATNNVKELLSDGVSYYTRVGVKCLHSTTEENFTIDFRHYYDAGVSTTENIVTFTNTVDATITQKLDGSGDNEGALPKTTGTSSKLIPSLKNTGNDRGIYLHNDIGVTEYCTYEISIRQSKVG